MKRLSRVYVGTQPPFGSGQFFGQPYVIIDQIIDQDPGPIGVGLQSEQVRFTHSPLEVRNLPAMNRI
jgi:hypothetical protein